jgi:hypothetical protein
MLVDTEANQSGGSVFGRHVGYEQLGSGFQLHRMIASESAPS